jgi:hypothetical protein
MDRVVVQPLERLYRYGPRAWGFWGGAADHAICAAIAPRVDPRHWSDATDECERMVATDVNGWVTLVGTTLYFYILFETTRWAVRSSLGLIELSAKKAGRWLVGTSNGRRSDGPDTMGSAAGE